MNFILLIISTLILHTSAQTRTWNALGCRNHGQVTDQSGRVIKGVCEIPSQLNYDNSVAACAAIGMDLFYAEDVPYIFESFRKYINATYTSNTTCGQSWNIGCGLWINGKKENGVWTKTVNGQKSFLNENLYPMAIWTDQLISGDCKVVKRLQGGIGTNNWDCARLFSPICEYNNTYTAPINCTSTNQGKRFYNLNACKSIETIRDKCGNVIKGVCELNSSPVNYVKAVQVCRNAGMDLFAAENQAVYDGFITYVKNNYFDSSCGSVWGSTCGNWVAGIRFSTAQNDYARVKDLATIKMPIQSNSVYYNIFPSDNAGSCLVLKRKNNFGFMDYDCNASFGEFKVFIIGFK